MMEITQLSRPQASPAKNSETRPEKAPVEGRESAEFDQHLQQQMDQSRCLESAEDKPVDSVKAEENQQLVDNVDEPADDLPEQPQASQPALAAEQLLALPAEQPVAEVVAEEQPQMAPVLQPASDDSILQAADEQSLPQPGNNLPPQALVNQATVEPQVAAAAQAISQATSEQPSRTPEALSTRPQPVVTGPAPQSAAAVASGQVVEDGLEFIPAELKMALKTARDGDSKHALPVTAKTSLNMASIASAASSLQQVPLTTATAAMHNHGGGLPAMDNLMTTTPTLSSTLNTPVQNPAWSQGVAERVAWMVQGNIQSAELKLNPANLGPLEIKLTMHDDNKATIHFVTSHAAVRDALDAAMPRLRDMLESQGLDMADVNVSDSGVQAQTDEGQQGDAGVLAAAMDEGETSGESPMQESIMRVDVADGLSIYA